MRVRLEFASRVTGELALSAVRAGMFKPLGDDALERAAALAADADVAVVWRRVSTVNGETEGNDRADMELVGRQNELGRPRRGCEPQNGGCSFRPALP